jgi:hypothetical protein
MVFCQEFFQRPAEQQLTLAQMEYEKTNVQTSSVEADFLDDIGLTISKKGWLSCYCNNQENYEEL